MVAVLIGLIISGCGNSQKAEEEAELAFPEASFTMSTEAAKVNEEITFTTQVTEGKESVEDADVNYEFWMEGEDDEEHPLIPVDHEGDGVYVLKKSFEKPGKYYMYYHVDARGMHLMDKREFIVE